METKLNGFCTHGNPVTDCRYCKDTQKPCIDKVKEHIQRENSRCIDEDIKQMQCNHKWVKYGHGYKCLECDYYTGMHTTLNGYIHDQLKNSEKPCPDCEDGKEIINCVHGLHEIKCCRCNGTGYIKNEM